MPENKKPIDYKKEIRGCAISAVHASIARAMDGEWRSSAWESYIDHGVREPRDLDADDLKGKFRRNWMPKDPTLTKIEQRLPESLAGFWAKLPLWKLLEQDYCEFSAIDEALQSLSGHRRRLVWAANSDGPSAWELERGHQLGMKILAEMQQVCEKNDAVFDSAQNSSLSNEFNALVEEGPGNDEIDGAAGFGALRYEPSKHTFDTLASEPDLQSLLTLVALTKEARCRRQLRPMVWGAHAIRRVLPSVLANTLELYVRWPTLIQAFNKQLFQPPSVDANFPWIQVDVESISEELELLRSIPEHLLPPRHLII